jgi:hypothetical protein
MSVTGPLSTCGGDQGWLNVSLQNILYTPDVIVLEVGETTGFQVLVTLDPATPNPCQGQPADIHIVVSALATDDGVEPTPTPDPDDDDPTPTPDVDDENDDDDRERPRATATPTPFAEVESVQQPGPEATFTAEMLPTGLPSTGSGGLLDDDLRDASRWALIGTGGLAALLFILSLVTFLSRRPQDR